MPNEEDDEFSVGDWSKAFLHTVGYDPDGPPKAVWYRPYIVQGCHSLDFHTIFRLLGSIYGMSQAPMDWCETIHNWLVLETGAAWSGNDKATWLHLMR